MHKEITYTWLTDKCICALLVVSMLSVVRIEIARFPVYSLMLLILASIWMVFKIIYSGREGLPFLAVRYRTDTAAMAAILYAVISVVIKIFGTLEEGKIDFSWNAEVIALAIICLLISSGEQFRRLYLDLILYSGLLMTGLYMMVHLTDGWNGGRLAEAFADSGQTSSYFLLVSMVSVYGYCTCKDKMRSVFYAMVSGIGFFALSLNQNVISLWLMGIFLIVLTVLFLGRMYKNYAQDKSVTGISILISAIFFVQILFWNPGMHNIACYFCLLATASFYKEEREQMESIGIRLSDLKLKIQEIQM